MSTTTYFDNIQKYLHQYVDLIESSNSLGLTDKTVHAENIFAEIMNITFEWNLKNANQVNKNQDSFDLIDEQNSVYVQVTSNKNHKLKYTSAVTSFLKKHDNGEPKRFIVLFIAKNINRKLLNSKTEDTMTSEAFDIQRLLENITYNIGGNPKKLEKLHNILQKTIYPVLLEGNKFSHSSSLLSQNIKDIQNGIYIKRDKLITDLFDFAQKGNGLILGGPGFGKSFIIDELQRSCYKQGIPCIVIRINELAEGSDLEINTELNTSEGWVELLSNNSAPSSLKGLLIFDACRY